MSSRDLVDDLKRILPTASKTDSPNPHSPRKSIPGSRSVGQASKGTDTAGIASPLTEQDASKREFYDTQLKTSSDGLFVLPIQPIKTMYLEDANKNEVVIKLAQPQEGV